MTLTADEPLVEREAQLSALRRRIADAERREGGLVLIEGEPGIGKTRLLAAAVAHARERGLVVLSARGGERERDFAFGIVRQLLERQLQSTAPSDREQLMAGAARFAEDVFTEPAADAQRSGDPSFAVLHGLYWLVANLADRAPLVLAVDDAHWADRPSLRFVGFLARRLEGMGVLLVLASRRDEPGAEASLLRSLCQELETRPIEPRLLSEVAVARLVRLRLGDAISDELCAACHHATGGNPFLLSELLIELTSAEPGSLNPAAVRSLAPRGVAIAVLARLRRLPQPAVALARAVAVLGERAELSHAGQLAQLDAEDALLAADLLADAAILERGRQPGFVHPIVQSAIYEAIAPAQRARLHARAARLLAEHSGESDAIAQQLLASDPAADAWVVQMLRDAARSALTRGAPEVAARYLRRALAEPPESRAGVLVELGSAETRAGDPSAREHLATARGIATDPWHEVQATIELAQVLAYEGNAREATALALHTLEAMSDQPEAAKAMKSFLLVLSQTDLAARLMTQDLVRRAGAVVERLGEAAPRTVLAVIASEKANVDGIAQEVAAMAMLALADGRMVEEATAESPHPYIAAMALDLAGHGEVAEREFSAAIVDALKRGSVRGFGHGSAFRAWCRYRRGDLAGAEADAQACQDLASDPAQTLFRPLALSVLVNVLVERGDLEGAAAALASFEREHDRHAPQSAHAQPLLESRARLFMAEGKPRDALVELGTYARFEEAWGASNCLWVQWRSAAAIAHATLGEGDQARSLVDDEVARTRRFGSARATGVALSAAGIVHSHHDGIELLREAVTLLECSDARLEHARAFVRLGALLRREGHRTDSREPLRSGLDLATRIGASALVESARQELLTAGGRPRRTVLTGVEALTPSERRVVEPAAAGLTNREIAQSLFLTVRTIEMHLSNAYHKLGIRSRDQLAAVLGAD